jgi:hypothetical protein
MSARVRELTEKQEVLQRRCAAQRASVAREVAGIEARFAGLDRAAGFAQSALLHPAVIGAGMLALLMLGRARGVRLLGRALLLSMAARRLIGTLKRL